MKKKSLKNILGVFLAIILFVAAVVPGANAFAAESTAENDSQYFDEITEKDAMTRFKNISSASCGFYRDGVNLVMTANVKAKSSQKINIVFGLFQHLSSTYDKPLERYEYNHTGTSYSVSKKKFSNILMSYKLTVTITVGGEKTTFTKYVDKI